MALTALLGSLNNGYAIPLILGVGIFSLCVRFLLFGVKMDPQEPRLAKSRIPYFGHAMGMFHHQTAYLSMLSEKNPVPAFTMNLMSAKVYIVTDPVLAQSALRGKTMVFEPFIEQAAERMLGVSEHGMTQIRYNPENEKEETYLRLAHRSMQESMAPGNSLLQMNARVLGKLADFVNEVGCEWESKPLFLWLRDIFTLASSSSLYGRNDPFAADPSLIDSLWDFESDQLILYTQFYPTIFAPKASKGRARIQAAFRSYYAAGCDSDAGGLVKATSEAARRYAFSNEDIGDTELSTIYVATTNALPSAFWLLCFILADPYLLSQIRNEVLSVVETTLNPDGTRTMTFDVTQFHTACPMLLSSYHESLRLTNAQVSGRFVAADTLLSYPSSSEGPTSSPSTYLLKKGNIVQMPSSIFHLSPAIWGADAHLFNPHRFLPSTKDALPKEIRKLQAQAFIPFGGGKHLCPGRYFAQAEILGLVAMVTAGFEVVQDLGDRAAPMSVPQVRAQKFGEGVRKPERDPKVRVRRRMDCADVRWAFKVGEAGEGAFEAFGKVL